MIKINLEKANDVAKDIVRQHRKPLLEKLDIKFQIAMESGSEEQKGNIVDEKNKLRDMPNYTEVKTVEELNQMIDEIKSYKVLS